MLRSLGHNPSKEDLEIFTTLVDEDRSGTIDFREFLILISQLLLIYQGDSIKKHSSTRSSKALRSLIRMKMAFSSAFS